MTLPKPKSLSSYYNRRIEPGGGGVLVQRPMQGRAAEMGLKISLLV